MENGQDFLVGEAPVFPVREDMGPRDWGKETLLCLVSGEFMMKELNISAGSKGGLQFHRLKNECAILLEGKMCLRYTAPEGQLVERVLGPGDVFHFPPGVVHQEEAITDCRLIECSTPHFNDRVRMEEYFGLETGGGLETTQSEEIISK